MSRTSLRVMESMALLGPLALAAALSVLLAGGHAAPLAPAGQRLSGVARARLGAVAVPFVANRGQVDGAVAYYAPTFAGTAFVTRHGALVLALPPEPARRAGSGRAPRVAPVLVEVPVSGRLITPRGRVRTGARVTVIQGRDRARWKKDLPTYARVELGEVWPGVRYSLAAHGVDVERIFTIAPGASAAAIHIRIRGARNLALAGGRLIADTAAGPVSLSRPAAYQLEDGKRRPVPVAYTLRGEGYGFRLGRHDPSRPVVIDPLIRATYLGGSGFENVRAAIIDPANGALYVTGETQSANFPGTSGSAQPVYKGKTDAFVAKLNLTLTTLARATYLGGSNADTGAALAVAPASSPEAGDIYLTGDTQSTNFPGTTGGAQPNCAGTAQDCADTGDGFVAVLNADLTGLVQATYLGGTNIDDAQSVVVTAAGTVYVAGRTLSSDFPGTAGGAQPVPAGSDYSGFVAELSADLKTLDQATYLGGSAVNEIYALGIGPVDGDVYVAGDTSSSDFPCTVSGGPPPAGGGSCGRTTSGAQASYSGAFDAFVSILNPSLTSLLQSTYFGGTNFDQASALDFASNGNVYIGGQTSSTDLPGLSGAAQPTYGGNNDGFVALLNSALTTLTRTTYLGGGSSDRVNALAVSPNGDVYAAGTTASSDFPCTAPGGPNPAGGACPSPHAGAIPALAGSLDGFAALLSPALTELLQATYFGGGIEQEGTAMALAPAAGTATGDVYLTGFTTSANLPGTSGAAQPAYAGSSDGYAAAFAPDLEGPQVTMSLAVKAPVTVQRASIYSYKITVTNATAPTTEFDGTATNVTLDNILPVQATYQSSTSSQGTACTESGSVVICSLGSIAGNGASANVTIKVKATASGSAGDVATIRTDQAFTPDSVSEAAALTNIPVPNSNNGGASLLGVWTILGLAGLALLAILGLHRRT